MNRIPTHTHTPSLLCRCREISPPHAHFPFVDDTLRKNWKKSQGISPQTLGTRPIQGYHENELNFFLSFFCALVVPRNWYFFSGHVPPPQVLKEAKRGKKKREWKWKCVQSLCGSISEWSKGRFEARGVFRRIFLLCWKRNFIYEPADMSGRGREREKNRPKRTSESWPHVPSG